MHKFRTMYTEYVRIAKTSWKIKNLSDTKNYVEVKDNKLIADMMLDAYTRGAKSSPKINALINEYKTNELGYYPIHIKTDEHRKEIAYPFKFGGYMWQTEEGIEVRPFDFSSATPISESERNAFPWDTLELKVNGGSSIYYSVNSHTMWKPCKSRFDRFGFISMNLDSKSPYPTGVESTRNSDQFTSLGKIFTVRNSDDKTLFESDCFLKTIGEITYKDYTTKTGMAIQPITIIDENRGIREVTMFDAKTNSKVSKKSYELTDLVLVIDIDNGKQINYIKSSLLNMPYSPQYIIQEKGIGKTKKGNSTALVIVDRPMTKEQRQLILKAYRYELCCKYDVYAIDRGCTGVGYGKNPMKLHNNELQRQFFVLNNHRNYQTVTNLDAMLMWADEVVSLYEQYINDDDDKFISSREELKNSTMKFSEILKNLSETKEEFEKQTSSVFMDKVFIGCRNDVFVRTEGPIYALQHYLLHGIESVYDSNTASQIAELIYNDVVSRYDNSDSQITKNWIMKRLNWILEQDRSCLHNSSSRNQFLGKLLYQKNICIHNNSCRLVELMGKRFNADMFSNIKEFAELELKCMYSPVQQRHGADTQSIKSMLYASSKLGSNSVQILKELQKEYEHCFVQTNSGNNNIALDLMPPCDSDRNRRNIMANILMTKVSSEYVIKQYQKENSYGFEIEQVSKRNKTKNLAFWDLSLIYNKRFIDMEASNRKELIYHIALYMNAFCNQVIQFGIDRPNCKFNDIKSKDIKRICKNLYSTYNVNISIVHHIAISIKNGPKTPRELYFELCAMNTEEIANKIVSLCVKSAGASNSEGQRILRHKYRDEKYSGDIKSDISEMLTKFIGKNNKECTKKWIHSELLAYVKKILSRIKNVNKDLYTATYKTLRETVTGFIRDVLELTPDVVMKKVTIRKGLLNCQQELEYGHDALNSNLFGIPQEFYDKICRLKVVSNIA